MDHPSTSSPLKLKIWVRTHSPFRNRNKPLPPVPAHESPARHPGQPTSGNVSPPKSSRKKQGAGNTNRFIALLKHKVPVSQPQQQQQPPSSPPSTTGAITTSSKTTTTTTTLNAQRSPAPQHNTARKLFGSAKSRTPDLRTLSRKVSNLEAQLKEARRELDAVIGVSPLDDEENEQQQQQQQQQPDRPPAPPRTDSDTLNRKIEQRAESLSQRGRFDGLVENLLCHPQHQQHQPPTHPQAPSTIDRPITRRGPASAPSSTSSRKAPSHEHTSRSYADAEDAYEPVELGTARNGEGSVARQLLKRKHAGPDSDADVNGDVDADVGADAGWREMQRRVREFEAWQRGAQQPGAKRVRWSNGAPLAVEYRDEEKDKPGDVMVAASDDERMDSDRDHDRDVDMDMHMDQDEEDADTLTALPQVSPRVLRSMRRSGARAGAAPKSPLTGDMDDDSTTPSPATLTGPRVAARSERGPLTSNPNGRSMVSTSVLREAAAADEYVLNPSSPSSPPATIPGPQPQPASRDPNLSSGKKAKSKQTRVRIPPGSFEVAAPEPVLVSMPVPVLATDAAATGADASASAEQRHARLSKVVEEFEWDDAEIF